MDSKQVGKGILYGVLSICILFILCSVFFAILIKTTNMTEDSIGLVLLITSFIIMFIGGFTSGAKGKEKGWLVGGTTGFIFIIIMYLIKFLGFGGGFSSTQLLFYLGFMGTCVIGAIIGVNVAGKKSS